MNSIALSLIYTRMPPTGFTCFRLLCGVLPWFARRLTNYQVPVSEEHDHALSGMKLLSVDDDCELSGDGG